MTTDRYGEQWMPDRNGKAMFNPFGEFERCWPIEGRRHGDCSMPLVERAVDRVEVEADATNAVEFFGR